MRARTQWWLLAVLLAAALAASAQSANYYVHPSDGSCKGNSPCFSSINSAIQSAPNGTVIVVLANISETVNSTQGKSNITLMASPSTVRINGNITLNSSTVSGWTLRDFRLGNSVTIRNISGSLHIENLETKAIQVGPLTRNTTANITIRDVTVLTGGAESITVRAEPGYDIFGSITVEDCVVPRAINIEVHASSNPAILGADIRLDGNQLGRGAGVRALGTTSSGSASITGSVEMSNNTFTDHKLGVLVTGNVTGDISGGVTMHNNHGPWIAVLTSESNGGDLGPLTFTDNTTEEIEVVAWGDLSGPTVATGNNIWDLGGLTGLAIYALLIDGHTVTGSVTVSATDAPENDIVVRSQQGNISGPVQIFDNLAGRITFEARGGGIVTPYSVRDNELPAEPDPLSALTIQTNDGGKMVSGTIEGNRSDFLRLIVDGALTGNVEMTGNSVREQGTFVKEGQGAGKLLATGNHFVGNTQFNGFDAVANFNRHLGGMAWIAGDLDARFNWWGCNEGPDAQGCGEKLTANVDPYPWLVFSASTSCGAYPMVTVEGDLTRSVGDPQPPAGNVTPGSIYVTANVGTVVGSPAKFNGGLAAAGVNLPNGVEETTITARLDSESIVRSVQCDPAGPLFADGFESGDLGAWHGEGLDFETGDLSGWSESVSPGGLAPPADAVDETATESEPDEVE